ncbi:MAG: tRNA lysidine(34) synthetase TilS [Candidatus Dormibacteraeota bacterium]|nr:tRNA lysidine(34) synthetase TilS [Candidatus Dormibacteraeota bacterium]
MAGRRVLVAVSGGPDSTALLLWLLEHDIEVSAAHFDHGLRLESASEADQVSRLAARLGVQLISERRSAPLARGNRQAAARAARYEFLSSARMETGAEVVALAHTADDVVEGALMHLSRGAALAGLRGMPQVRGHHVRPLLGVWRSDIERYLSERQETPLRDPANREVNRSRRAWVRHVLLPRLESDRPGLEKRIWRAAQAAAKRQEELEAAAQALLQEIGSRSGSALRLERARLLEAPTSLRLEAYRQVYGRLAGLPGLSRRHLEQLDQLTRNGGTGQRCDLPSRVRFHLERESVTVVMEQAAPSYRLRMRQCPGCADPLAAHLRSDLELRLGRRVPGLRLRPSEAGSRKLQDVLTDAAVPRRLRDEWPLVFAGERLAWVPGVAVDVELAAVPGAPGMHVTVERFGSYVGQAGDSAGTNFPDPRQSPIPERVGSEGGASIKNTINLETPFS